MWVDNKGVFHTISLPDPTELMSDDFHDSFDLLCSRRKGDVSELIDLEMERFYDEYDKLDEEDASEEEFVQATPRMDILVGTVETIDDLQKIILEIDPRWRLDVLTNLLGYLP